MRKDIERLQEWQKFNHWCFKNGFKNSDSKILHLYIKEVKK